MSLKIVAPFSPLELSVRPELNLFGITPSKEFKQFCNRIGITPRLSNCFFKDILKSDKKMPI